MESTVIPYKCTPGRILIKLETSTDTIKLSNDAQESNIGIVMAIGETFTTSFGAKIDCPVKVGDRVQHAESTTMGTSAYQNVRINGEDYRVVLFDGISGIISGN